MDVKCYFPVTKVLHTPQSTVFCIACLPYTLCDGSHTRCHPVQPLVSYRVQGARMPAEKCLCATAQYYNFKTPVFMATLHNNNVLMLEFSPPTTNNTNFASGSESVAITTLIRPQQISLYVPSKTPCFRLPISRPVSGVAHNH